MTTSNSKVKLQLVRSLIGTREKATVQLFVVLASDVSICFRIEDTAMVRVND